jgi:hypothetical protein
MALQFSIAARNAALDAIETAIGVSPILRIRTGAPPANCAAARTGTVLATMQLPSDFMAAASGGSKALSGTWQDAAADAAGTAGHFEIVDSGGTACHLQGTVTAPAGGGDMEIQNTSLAVGQQVSVTSFAITAGGA